ncbi:MAG: hypothetical protein RR914_00320 [Oscillospiraceae bacterium]
MNKSKKIRSAVLTVVSFLLSIFLVLLALVSVLKATALNPKFAERMLVKSDYSTLLQKNVKEEFVSLGNAANVDESFFNEFFTSVITTDKVLSDTKLVFNSFYSGTPIEKLDMADLEKTLTDELFKYATQKGYSLTNELKSSIADLSKQMCDLYNSYVNIFGLSYFETAGSLLSRYTPYVTYAIIGFAVLSLISAFIIRMSYTKRKNVYRFYIYSFSGATLMAAVLPIVILASRVATKINIALPSLFAFATMFINQMLYSFLFSALILAAITALFAGLRIMFVKKNK